MAEQEPDRHQHACMGDNGLEIAITYMLSDLPSVQCQVSPAPVYLNRYLASIRRGCLVRFTFLAAGTGLPCGFCWLYQFWRAKGKRLLHHLAFNC